MHLHCRSKLSPDHHGNRKAKRSPWKIRKGQAESSALSRNLLQLSCGKWQEGGQKGPGSQEEATAVIKERNDLAQVKVVAEK